MTHPQLSDILEFHFIDVGFSLFKAQALIELVGNDTGWARSEHQRYLSPLPAQFHHLQNHQLAISLAAKVSIHHHIFYPCLPSGRALIKAEGGHTDELSIGFQDIEMTLG